MCVDTEFWAFLFPITLSHSPTSTEENGSSTVPQWEVGHPTGPQWEVGLREPVPVSELSWTRPCVRTVWSLWPHLKLVGGLWVLLTLSFGTVFLHAPSQYKWDLNPRSQPRSSARAAHALNLYSPNFCPYLNCVSWGFALFVLLVSWGH